MNPILGSHIQPVENKFKDQAPCSRCGYMRAVHNGYEKRRGTLCRSCFSTMSREEIEQWEGKRDG